MAECVPPCIRFAAVALLAALAVPLPAFCDEAQPAPFAAEPPAARAFAPAECVGSAPIGQVVSVSGATEAHAPGRAPRSLACDDALRACEEIVTAPGASLGFLSGDVLVRVGGDSRVALAGAEGAPSLFVRQGAVRSTDGSGTGPAPVKLATRDLAASASGVDAELSVAATGPSRLCAYAGSATVEAGAASRTLGAGRCLAAEGGGVASFDAAGEPKLGREAPGFCVFEVALDVAAPPAVPDGEPADDVSPDPCEAPGLDCDGDAGRKR